MGSENRDLAEAIRKLSGMDDLTQSSFACRVSNIDTTKYTCDCAPIDGSADFKGVRYNANGLKGFVLEPKDDSIVIITVTSNTTAFVSMVSEVNQIYLNGDNEGGLVKVSDLVDRINDIKDVVNDLITKYNTHTHILTLSAGTGTAAPTTTTEPSTIPITTVNELSNNKVKHGSS